MSLPLGTEEDMLAAPPRRSVYDAQPEDDEEEEGEEEEGEEEEEEAQSAGGASQSQRSEVMPSYAAVGREEEQAPTLLRTHPSPSLSTTLTPAC